MKHYNFKCVNKCEKICCISPTLNEFEKIKHFYDKTPLLLKVSIFNEKYFNNFIDIFFKQLVMDSLIRVKSLNGFYYINTAFNFSMPGVMCPILKNGMCSAYEYRPIKCKLFPLQEFLPFSWQYKVLEELKNVCLGIGKGDFLINKSGTKINNKAFENYIDFWKYAKEWNNFPTILKNIEILLNHHNEDIEEKASKNMVFEFVINFKTDETFFNKIDIEEKKYEEKQKELILNDLNIPQTFKNMFL